MEFSIPEKLWRDDTGQLLVRVGNQVSWHDINDIEQHGKVHDIDQDTLFIKNEYGHLFIVIA